MVATAATTATLNTLSLVWPDQVGAELIPLTNCPHGFLVDADDASRFRRFRWRLHPSGYPARYLKYKSGLTRVLYAHRLAVRASRRQFRGYVVDHINGDPLDCRKSNLRIITASQNARNRRKRATTEATSPFKGVYEDRSIKGDKRWKAQIHLEGRTKHLGRFKTQEEAARTYDMTAINNWGHFCLTNFPVEDYLKGGEAVSGIQFI